MKPIKRTHHFLRLKEDREQLDQEFGFESELSWSLYLEEKEREYLDKPDAEYRIHKVASQYYLDSKIVLSLAAYIDSSNSCCVQDLEEELFTFGRLLMYLNRESDACKLWEWQIEHLMATFVLYCKNHPERMRGKNYIYFEEMIEVDAFKIMPTSMIKNLCLDQPILEKKIDG